MSAIRIDRLAKALGVTRGSFYWHFEDRAALLRAVLEKWDTETTDATIAANEVQGGNAPMRLLRLLETCVADDGRLEMSVRAWAGEDMKSSAALAKVDTRRIDYMKELLGDCGLSTAVAEARARVIYLAWLGAYAASDKSDVAGRTDNMRALWRMALPTA
ncbi:MAG: TetR family transcriptional regulator [Hyphomonas sp.]|nr:TetR family transcriptional regulator [Hyphomonas sp.]